MVNLLIVFMIFIGRGDQVCTDEVYHAEHPCQFQQQIEDREIKIRDVTRLWHK